MKKNLLNISKNFGKLLLLLLFIFLLKNCLDVEFIGRFHLLSQRIFSQTIDIEIRIDLNNNQNKSIDIRLQSLQDYDDDQSRNIKKCSFVPPGLGKSNYIYSDKI